MKFFNWLFSKHLMYFLINFMATIISIATIIILCFNLTGLNSYVNVATLFILIVNSILLGIKTTVTTAEMIVKYRIDVKKDKALTERAKEFKKTLEKEEFN